MTTASVGFSALNAGDLIRHNRRPKTVAVIDLRDGGREWTFAAFEAATDAFARRMADRCARGTPVAIVADNGAPFLMAWLGLMRAGLVAVPVNHKLPPATVDHILSDAEIGLALVDRAYRTLLPDDFACLDLEVEAEAAAASPPTPGAPLAAIPRPGEIAEILYTSGSTGRPKGVPLSHEGQLWALGKHAQADPPADERTLIVAPLYHMNGLFNASLALVNGIAIVLMPRFDARLYLEAVARYRCTALSGVPTMFALMAREEVLVRTLDLGSVRRITIGSAPLTEALVARVQGIFPNAAIRNGYGITEAGPSIFGDHPAGLARPLLSLGHPMPEISWRLTGGASPDEGMLELKTPALFGEYLNLPEATAERLRDGWYATGDVMRRDSNGFFYFVGRADDMFVCGGENVYPGEIERMLERHPEVAQAAVVSVPDEIKGHIPIAFVVRSPGSEVSADELKAYALRNGPAYSHPRAFVFIDRLPVAGTHKIDKRPLLDSALETARSLTRRGEPRHA